MKSRVVVKGENGIILYLEEDAVNASVSPGGELSVSNETQGVIFARGHWAKVTSIKIKD